jgi:Arc/MetJ-type ribon-helix-helix transcriptional regulator
MPEEESLFERTTISLTAYQMREMKRRRENGIFPDLTEGIRIAVSEYLERHPLSEREEGSELCPATT